MNLALCIQHIYPGISSKLFTVVVENGTPRIAAWKYSEPKPTDEQLAAAWGEVEPTVILARVRAKRAREYPPMADYLDAQVKKASADPAIVAAGEAQESAYLSACLEVKEANPFPS